MEGTHEGTIFDIPPTGRRVKVDGMTIYRVRDGKAVENTWSMDSLGLLQQMGAIPAPEAPVA
jgi:predicted ester cyclase